MHPQQSGLCQARPQGAQQAAVWGTVRRSRRASCNEAARASVTGQSEQSTEMARAVDLEEGLALGGNP